MDWDCDCQKQNMQKCGQGTRYPALFSVTKDSFEESDLPDLSEYSFP